MPTSPLSLYEPLQTLKAIGDQIWIVDGPIVALSMYGAAIPFPTRMTIVRLQNQDLWCHSPIELTPALQAQVDRLGPVRHLVSPNKLHYAHINPWAVAYPEAITWAAPGVRARAASQGIVAPFRADLADTAPPDWSADLEQRIFRGSRFMAEVVFFHRASSTLIVTDLIENFELDKVSPRWHWLLQLMGIAAPEGQMPLDLRLTFWGRHEQAREGYQQLLAWQPERIVLAHGRWCDRQGTAALQRAFRWLGPPEG